MSGSDGAPSGANHEHYSYTHYADRGVAEGFDALRFSGPIGRYLLEQQENLLRRVVSPAAGRRVLDVGTGTGRAAIGLAKAGAMAVGLDASAEMLSVARTRAREAGVDIEFVQGDAHALKFPDRTFDVVVSLRVLMHTPDWRRCVAECCRVSRWRVVVDFPASVSVAALQSASRGVRARFGSKVEAYRALNPADVQAVLAAQGFRVLTVDRLFVLPIAFHKLFGSIRVTRFVERGLGVLGLTKVFGSPVTMVAER